MLPRLLGVASALVLPFALGIVWAGQAVTDTEGYVETVAPLARDQAVHQAAAARLAAATNGLVRQQLGPRAAKRISVRTEKVASRVVDSEAFASAWRRGNRVTHRQLERVLNSDRASPVVFDLSLMVDDVVAGVRDSGMPLREVDTTSSLRVRLASSSTVARAQVAYGVIDTFGLLAVAAWVLLLLSALVAGSDRRSVLAVTSAASAVTTSLLWLALWLGDDVVTSGVAATDGPLVRAVYDVLTDDLERWALAAVAVSVLVALVTGLAPRATAAPDGA